MNITEEIGLFQIKKVQGDKAIVQINNPQVAAEADISKMMLTSGGSSVVIDQSGNKTGYNRKETKKLMNEMEDGSHRKMCTGLNMQMEGSISSRILKKIEEAKNNPEIRLACEKARPELEEGIVMYPKIREMTKNLSEKMDVDSLELKIELSKGNEVEDPEVKTTRNRKNGLR